MAESSSQTGPTAPNPAGEKRHPEKDTRKKDQKTHQSYHITYLSAHAHQLLLELCRRPVQARQLLPGGAVSVSLTVGFRGLSVRGQDGLHARAVVRDVPVLWVFQSHKTEIQ